MSRVLPSRSSPLVLGIPVSEDSSGRCWPAEPRPVEECCCHLRESFVFGKLATTPSEPLPPAHGEDARIHAMLTYQDGGGPINVDLIRHGVQYRGSW